MWFSTSTSATSTAAKRRRCCRWKARERVTRGTEGGDGGGAAASWRGDGCRATGSRAGASPRASFHSMFFGGMERRDSGCRRQRRASAKGPPRSVMIPAPAIARRPSAESPPFTGSPTTSTKLRRRAVGRPRERHAAVQLETVRLAPAHGRLSRRSSSRRRTSVAAGGSRVR
jgi:hypothetical protein